MAINAIAVKGMFRVRVNEDGKIVGDSGWRENEVTNLGFNQYIVSSLGSIAGSKYISHVGIGTGGTINPTTTALPGEVGTRQGVTAATSSSSKTLNLTATFASGWHTITDAQSISNIGLFNSVSAGTLFSGNTFASSSCASNQAVNVTYDLTFATT
jgi:hypothetical protein